ncbi:MAG: glycosyltransferase family 2 protein [Patescibacteria group bacterium]
MKFSLVIPCYNEVGALPLIIGNIKNNFLREDLEVIIVDNGSTDGSGKVLGALTANIPRVRVVTVPINNGYGYGIIAGLKEASGEYLGWTHGDMQTPVQDALKALKIIEAEGNPTKIFLKGQRTGRSFFDRIFTAGMSVFESALFGIMLRDINAQPNVFHRSLMKQFFNPPNDFSLDLYVYRLAKINGFVIKRFPVSFLPRPHGESHWNTTLRSKYNFIKRVIRYSFSLKNSNKYGK